MPSIKVCVLLATICMVTAGCSESDDARSVSARTSPAPAQKPVRNLVLICIDTVRADTFFKLGAKRQGPLTKWRKKALVYTHANATASWTLPSLASVFTGLWTVQHGVDFVFNQNPGSKGKFSPTRMPSNTLTLALAAADNGFDTEVFSASGWTSRRHFGFGIQRGFEEFHDYGIEVYDRSETTWQPLVEDWSEQIHNSKKKTRTLYFLHFMDAHNWHMAKSDELDARIADLTPAKRALYKSIAPENACEDSQSIYCRRFLVYASAVSALRDAIAQVLDNLQSANLLNETAVIAFADHGEEFADHLNAAGNETQESVFDDPSVIPGFGHGQTLYQELLHVPLLIWHPGYAGRTVDAPVSLIDVAPTAAHWLGLGNMSDQAHGWLLDNFGRLAADADHRVLYASGHFGKGPTYSARQGTWKAIWPTESGHARYYNLDKDPHELQPVREDKLVLQFDALFLDYDRLKPRDKSHAGTISKEQLKKLQAIGYLQGEG